MITPLNQAIRFRLLPLVWVSILGGCSSVAPYLPPSLPSATAFTADDLSLALGLENAIHAVLLAGGRADRWTIEVERLAGFRPLRPPHWDVSSVEDGSAGAPPTGAS